jgi:hypothetical protein
LLGIVDMYGAYGTLGSLTIMSYSWDLPPGDFAAYERLTLGWLKPQAVTQTTRGLWLPRATDQIAAVKVTTSRAAEYFLIEYRHRPESGFGSADVDYNGLVVYHVLEGSSMSQNPPIVKVEPADGSITPSRPTDPYNFVYPGNPYWTPPMVLYSYYGDLQEVFRIDNVVWVDGGMSFDVIVAPPQPTTNLLTNPSFENGQGGVPFGWATRTYIGASSGFVWPSQVAVDGKNSAQIESPFDNDKSWNQPMTTVVGQTYRVCGWLKGDAIGGSGNTGANLSVLGTWAGAGNLLGTFGWTQRCFDFTAETTRADVACRLGFTASMASGTLWCDDLSVERIRSAF